MAAITLHVQEAFSASASLLRSREQRQLHSLHRWQGTLRFFRHHPRQRWSRTGRREHRKALVWVYVIRRELRETRAGLRPVAPWTTNWYRAALCIHAHEGAWNSATGNGYWGGMQFTLYTWGSVGGRGLPSLATPREQLLRAWLVWRRDGGSWREWSTAASC